MNNKRFFDLLVGIGFVVLGIMALNRPLSTLGFLVFFFGALAVVRGITTIFGFGSMSANDSKGLRIILGIFDLIIGIMLLTNIIRGALFLGIMFAVWFMIESIGNLFLTARFSKAKGFGKVLVLIFDLIALVFAVLLLFNPIIATFALPKLVGFSSVAFGIVLMVQGSNVGGSTAE